MRSITQRPKIVDRTQLGMDRIVAAFAATDCIWAADVVRLASEAIILSLAVFVSDRVDRCEIKNIEAHVANFGKAPDDVGESAVTLGRFCRRTREQLIPGGKLCLRQAMSNRVRISSAQGPCPFIRVKKLGSLSRPPRIDLIVAITLAARSG